MAERTSEDPAGLGRGYLALVTTLALALRLFHLGHQSLWIDESFTWELIEPGQGLRFWSQILQAYQGPLYHAAAWVAVRIAPTVAALRTPAMLAGVAAVPILGVVAARIFDRATGRLAALLLALSPFHLWYSQEARGYSFLILFAVASGLVFLRLRDEIPSWRRAFALAALTGAGLASNLTFVFLLAAFGLTLLATAPPRTPRGWALWAVGLGGGVLLVAPWLLRAAGIWALDRALPGADTGDALRGATTFTPWALPFTAFSFLYGFSLGPSLAELHQPDRLAAVRENAAVLAAAASAGALAAVLGLRRLRGRQWELAAWVLVPLAGVAFLAMRNIKPFNVRYVAPALPWVLVIVAAGTARLRRPWNLALATGLCVLFTVSLIGYYFDGRYDKADVRGAVAHIAAQDARRLPILAPNVGGVVRYYYAGKHDILTCAGEPEIEDEAGAAALVDRQLDGRDAAWVVWAHTWFLDPHDLLPAALARRGRLVRTYEGPGVAVDLWSRDASEVRGS